MQVWGANMDWQLILDPGMVIDYMTKYVTKNDMSSNAACGRLMKSLFHKTVQTEGRSVQSFLRRTMSKLLGERMMSKQESCHLMLGIPIVYCSHKQINIDLRNESRQVVVASSSSDPATSNDASNVTPNAETDNVIVMSTIDAYGIRMDQSKWKTENEFSANANILQEISLLEFCSNFKVLSKGLFKNKITKDNTKIVINFYPSLSSSQLDDKVYTQYCKYALMKYRPWTGSSKNAWNWTDANTTDADIRQLWSDYMDSFDEGDAPDFLRRAIDDHQKHAKDSSSREEDEMEIERNEDGSFQSDDAVPPVGEDYLCEDNPNISELMREREVDDIDACDIKWDEEFDWAKSDLYNEIEDFDGLKELFDRMKEGTISRNRRQVSIQDLNKEQRLAHDMIVRACAADELSITDGGDGIGRLQILLGAGGTGKSFVIDAVITTLSQRYNWTDDKYSIHATTGKAATSIGGSTIQNYKDGLGFFSTRFKPLSPKLLAIFQQKWKHKRLIVIDEYSMLRQKELHYIDRRLKQIMNNLLPFGGLVVVLAGDPAQLPPVKGNCLWNKKCKNSSDDSFGYLLYGCFETAMKLIVNERLDHDDADAIRFEEFLLRLRNGYCTQEDWEYIRDIASRDTVSREKWKPFEGDDVIHLYSTNKEVNERNIECLQRVGNPIVRIDAEHTGDGRKASANQANGLERKAFLCKGAFVLLTKNVWQSAGLCNGATGYVVELIFFEGRPPPGLPECVIVDFGENYTGPPLFGTEDNGRRGWVPIYPE